MVVLWEQFQDEEVEVVIKDRIPLNRMSNCSSLSICLPGRDSGPSPASGVFYSFPFLMEEGSTLLPLFLLMGIYGSGSFINSASTI